MPWISNIGMSFFILSFLPLMPPPLPTLEDACLLLPVEPKRVADFFSLPVTRKTDD